MNVDRRLFPMLFVIAVLLPAVVGLAFDWPIWVWIPLAVGLVVGLLVFRQIQQRRSQEELRRRTVEPAFQPRVEVPVSRTSLPVVPLASAKPDYEFQFACTMNWRPVEGHAGAEQGDPRALVAEHLVGRAAAAVGQESPADLALAHHRLAMTLGRAEVERSGRYLVWADDVSLVVPEADAARLRKLADLRKQEELWEHERGFERSVRAYLGEDVLKDTGSAVVWWLAKHTEQVSETAGLITTLARLSAAANHTEVDPLFGPPALPAPHPVAQHNGNGSSPGDIHHYLPEFEESKAWFGRQLHDLLLSHEEPERAKRVEDSYNPDCQESLFDDPENPDQR
ncbi:hypothetical protein [Umezawaea sp. Da 62-37]|uniref:hypothetical protein n=1 Tax=Umezawaea sp. Da 62-37 TaxID=3075927 RepID=UPI0028F6DCD9|nr:hypothetical protein [Umezawaea sp. Da 62-37]WNV82800.1 hypothetical protein RM788_31975 [Umezawaea sp. Da 62-37]